MMNEAIANAAESKREQARKTAARKEAGTMKKTNRIEANEENISTWMNDEGIEQQRKEDGTMKNETKNMEIRSLTIEEICEMNLTTIENFTNGDAPIIVKILKGVAHEITITIDGQGIAIDRKLLRCKGMNRPTFSKWMEFESAKIATIFLKGLIMDLPSEGALMEMGFEIVS